MTDQPQPTPEDGNATFVSELQDPSVKTEAQIDQEKAIVPGTVIGETPIGLPQATFGYSQAQLDAMARPHADVLNAIAESASPTTQDGRLTPAVLIHDNGEPYVHISYFRKAVSWVERESTNELHSIEHFLADHFHH